MLKDYSLKPEKFYAAVGPHLRKCHFEVTEEFLPNFPEKYFSKVNGEIYFNSTQFVCDQLIQNGVQEKNIILNGDCTFCNSSYFSYRREGITGRQIGFIGIFPN